MATETRHCVSCGKVIGKHRRPTMTTCSVKCRVALKRLQDVVNGANKLKTPTAKDAMWGRTDSSADLADGGVCLICWDAEDWKEIKEEAIRRRCSMTTVIRDAVQYFFVAADDDVDVDHEDGHGKAMKPGRKATMTKEDVDEIRGGEEKST